MNKNKKIKKYEFIAGFTLVEALVAISILMIAVTGPMVVAQKGLVSAIGSKDQMIAAFLAQDAIEYIKNVRDSNGVQTGNTGVAPSDGWLSYLTLCIDDLGKFKCNIDSFNLTPPLTITETKMCTKRDKSDARVFQGYGIRGVDYGATITCDQPKFSRQIVITKTVSNPNEAYIDVLVSWGTGLDQQFRVGSYIYNYWGNI